MLLAGGIHMEELLYEMIFKRKFFHLFKNTGHISDREDGEKNLVAVYHMPGAPAELADPAQ